MRFTELLDSATKTPGSWTLDVAEDWRQGRAIFGGLQVALCVAAMRDLVPDGLPLRTVQATFLAPPTGSRATARARVLRQGKSATHVQALLVDAEASVAGAADDSVVAMVTAVFGAGRPSLVTVSPTQPRVTSDEPRPFRFVPGVTPTFTQHFAATWLTGALPFDGSAETTASVEVSMPGESRASEALVIALCDFMPPLALSMLTVPAPGSSLTWTLELLAHSFDTLFMQGFRVDAELLAAHDGYTNQSCMVWGPGGEPVALSRQAMVVFG